MCRLHQPDGASCILCGAALLHRLDDLADDVTEPGRIKRLGRALRIIAAPKLLREQDAPAIVGVARRHLELATAPLTGVPCLAAHARLEHPQNGAIWLHELAWARFWVDGALVEGPMVIHGPSVTDPDARRLLERAGGTTRLHPNRVVSIEHVVQEGDTVAVSGPSSDEIVPHGPYRDGRARVFRGEPGRPVHIRVRAP